MAINKVEICGVDTSTLPVLTNERMRELFPLVHSGDLNAREEFIRGNLRLVLSVIQRFRQPRAKTWTICFRWAASGSSRRWTISILTLNVRFSTYAVPMIIGEIRRYLRDNNAIRVSRSLRDIAYKALKARDQLSEKLGREPNVNELAEALHLPREDVVFALEAIQDPVSLFEPVYQRRRRRAVHHGSDHRRAQAGQRLAGRDRRAGRHEPPERTRTAHSEAAVLIRAAPRWRSPSEIGISQAQVSRLEKNALVHMRKNMGL